MMSLIKAIQENKKPYYFISTSFEGGSLRVKASVTHWVGNDDIRMRILYSKKARKRCGECYHFDIILHDLLREGSESYVKNYLFSINLNHKNKKIQILHRVVSVLRKKFPEDFI